MWQYLMKCVCHAYWLQNWGGGTFCMQNPGFGCGVGHSKLPYGSPAYFGLGFFVLCITLFLELFGSPFMRSCQVALGLLFGYVLAAFTSDWHGSEYVSFEAITDAPAVTFLWTTRFPIGFYAPALLPVLIGFVVSGLETIGDLTATGEASGLEPDSDEQARAVQGGLLGDAVNSLFAALAYTMPNTTFSQNNGVVSMTRVASRLVGFGCAVWLLLFGIFGKVGAFFTSIPAPVLGGMTTLLFANIAISGIKVITSVPTTRRVRFIVATAAAFGLGVTIVPSWTANLLPCEAVTNGALQGICMGAELTLTTGYAIGCISALVLHAILPADLPEGDPAHTYDESVRRPSQEDMKHLQLEMGGTDDGWTGADITSDITSASAAAPSAAAKKDASTHGTCNEAGTSDDGKRDSSSNSYDSSSSSADGNILGGDDDEIPV